MKNAGLYISIGYISIQRVRVRELRAFNYIQNSTLAFTAQVEQFIYIGCAAILQTRAIVLEGFAFDRRNYVSAGAQHDVIAYCDLFYFICYVFEFLIVPRNMSFSRVND